MSQFVFEVNPQTKLREAQFAAKLVSIATKPIPNKVSGKEYYPCSIQFANKDGEEITRSAIMNAKNFDYGVKIGDTYRSRVAIQQDGSALISVSHLQGADRASTSDFE